MRIISDFENEDNEYKVKLAKIGDVIVAGGLKYIVIQGGYISENGVFISSPHYLGLINVIIKREPLDFLEDLLIEGEKRCKY